MVNKLIDLKLRETGDYLLNVDIKCNLDGKFYNKTGKGLPFYQGKKG